MLGLRLGLGLVLGLGLGLWLGLVLGFSLGLIFMVSIRLGFICLDFLLLFFILNKMVRRKCITSPLFLHFS